MIRFLVMIAAIVSAGFGVGAAIGLAGALLMGTPLPFAAPLAAFLIAWGVCSVVTAAALLAVTRENPGR